MLTAHRLSVHAGAARLLDGVSARFAAGELVMVVGANGAGKTTLLRCLNGELEPGDGRVEFGGKPLAQWNALELARARAVLPQNSTLNFPFSVTDVVLMGRMPHATSDAKNRDIAARALSACDCAHLVREAARRPDAAGRSRDEGARGPSATMSAGGEALPGARASTGENAARDVEVRRDTRRFRAAGRARVYTQLSGGEQQRVQIARVLAQVWEPPEGAAARERFLLLDEPVAALDWSHQYALLRLLKNLSARENVGVVCTLHDLNLVAQFADRVVILDAGRKVADGAPLSVFSEEVLRRVFHLEVAVRPHPDASALPLLIPRLSRS